jgi:hypothetical protein
MPMATLQGGFGGEMRCGWMDVHYVLNSYINSIQQFFVYLVKKNHLERFSLSHRRTLAVA